MGCTIEMYEVLHLPQPKGPIPAGMKVIALQDPNTLQSAPTSPVLAVGGFTLWPMSYSDNRVSFGMVMYDLKWNVHCTHEIRGARYVTGITLQGSGENGTITFTGQSNQSVTMSVSDVCNMLFGMSAEA